MIRCTSCEGALTSGDRFCPACGTPNRNARFHPKFGPAPKEPPGPPERPSAPPVGVPSCPRCWAVVRLADPYCTACGLSLDQLREAAARAEFLGMWTVPGPGAMRRYRPLRGPSAVVRLLFGVLLVGAVGTGLAAVAALYGDGAELSALGPDSDLSSWAARAQLAVAGAAVVLVPVFVWWFAIAYRNLSLLGVRGMRFTPRWAVVAWFIPLVDLVVPKELTDDLYRGSDPDVPLLSTTWRQQNVPLWVHLWWVALLASIALLPVAHWALVTGGGFGQSVALAASVAIAVSAVLGLVLVGEVTQRQADRADGLGPVRRPGHPMPAPSTRYRTGLEQHAAAFAATPAPPGTPGMTGSTIVMGTVATGAR